ncbi:hypothetical protein BGZ80_000173 [Entomortierella chlamydospora]|uniref:Calcineurin-like phosphoesterase domain-containing protein n=1 Tax=Entomortierella chlamydospora TaxID=101097 RepID=A0A9P6N3J3_9FUNG|nr:hypothetical protein BGZ79_008172 [Entomortierella chlamydospora]KAG0022471.1 hypothetical protein BGZ80_000173 [Entomortierella chlamydospora]
MKSSWEPLEMLSSYITREQNDSWTYKPKSPTHVGVLGDLFSSQWIDDNEFNVRLARYRSIFPDPATTLHAKKTTMDKSDGIPILINITGNHDIGYGNDISQTRLDRWEQVFGRSNFIESVVIPDSARLKDPQPLGHSRRLHFVVLNTMLLDGPSSDENLRGQTWQFLQKAAELKAENPEDKIVILTHIPFHKEQGICVDAPDIHVHWDNTIIEQTMLTPNSTTWILNNIKPDFVLNGHDHYGCDIVHVRSWDEGTGEFSWMAYSTSELPSELETKAHEHEQIDRQDKISIREVTQRSMMAEFGGYAGLFEARISETNPDRIEFHYSACGFYNDLQVWIMIVTIAIVVGAWVLIISARVLAALRRILISKTRKHQGSTEEKLKKL